MVESTTFHVRVDDGPERTIAVRTSIYNEAAAAVPALLGLRPSIKVEVWLPGRPSRRFEVRYSGLGLNLEVVPD